MKGNLQRVCEAVSAIADEAVVDQCLLEQYDEQENSFKLELYYISMDGDVSELSDDEAWISKTIYDVCLKLFTYIYLFCGFTTMQTK